MPVTLLLARIGDDVVELTVHGQALDLGLVERIFQAVAKYR